MPKLKLVAEPTFKATVEIPIAGSAPVSVVFTFRHRTKTQLAEFTKASEGKSESDLDFVMGMVCGWELDDEWTAENVALLLENYHGAAAAISMRYPQVLVTGKQGN